MYWTNLFQNFHPPPPAGLQLSPSVEQWEVNSEMEGWLSGHKVNHDDVNNGDDINDGDDSDDDINDGDDRQWWW